MGAILFKQEYLAEFVDDMESIFTSAQIARALDTDETPIYL